MIVIGAVLGLCAALLRAVRSRRMMKRVASTASEPFGPVLLRRQRMAWLCALLATVLGGWPILRSLPIYLRSHAVLAGDAASHAAISNAVVQHGLPHGWVDGYYGGFPFGVHYQSVHTLVMAGLIAVGSQPALAAQLVGVGSTLALPLVVLAAGRSLGARPLSAAVAALLVAWIAPDNPFFGGYEQYLLGGLAGQALALPIAVAAAVSVLRPGPRWRAPVLFALLLATHPQIAASVFVCLAPFVALHVRTVGPATLRGAVASLAMAVALFGPGLESLHLPFGFPAGMPVWRQIGVPFAVMLQWAQDGTLFDKHRAPITSILWLASVVYLCLRCNRRVPAALALSNVLALTLSSSGYWMASLGAVGRVMLTFVMPLRIAAVLPILIAATLAYAVDDFTNHLPTRVRFAPGWLAALSLLVCAAPSRFDWGLTRSALLARMNDGGGTECAGRALPGFSSAALAAAVARVDRGRLAIEQQDIASACVSVHGVELASHVPMTDSGGAGGQVGTNVAAFEAFRPRQPGAYDRAESLGIRAIVYTNAIERPLSASEWNPIYQQGAVQVSERVGGTYLVGAACVDERWSGSEAALRQGLTDDLKGSASLLSHPASLIELAPGTGPLVREHVERSGCDPRNVVIQEPPNEPGLIEADVDSPTEFDSVFRATAYPRWHVVIDETPVPARMVAPGFFAARVPAGHHHIRAETSWPRFYMASIAAAGIFALLLGTPWPTRRRPPSKSPR